MSATQRLQAILDRVQTGGEWLVPTDIERAIAELLIEIAEMVGLRDE